ncbi:hypothetical protein G9A89_014804 [Geosiphon pyriformis]|nr:hypothetical protein G9A89_014804 [Geosiphon pyriformis]
MDNYQAELLPLPTWKEKRKGKAEKKLQSALVGYPASRQRKPKYIMIFDVFGNIEDDPEYFHKHYQNLALTKKEQKQRLANLNMKLCNHCLIPCHFQYCDKCNIMFNPPSKKLYPITKLLESKVKEELITKNMSLQDPTKDTETAQYFVYSDLSKELELK